MNKLVILFGLLAATIVVVSGDLSDEEEWEQHKAKHSLKFHCPHKHNNSKAVFFKNSAFVKEHNSKFQAKQVSFKVALNQYSHLSQEEMQQGMMGLKSLPKHKRGLSAYNINLNGVQLNTQIFKASNINLPSSFSWADSCHPKVKNQNYCGCCWAHSSTTAIEYNYCSQLGQTINELSPQQLVDCAGGRFLNNGCFGGFPIFAFEYIKQNSQIALVSEAIYPFTSGQTQNTGPVCLSKSGASVTNIINSYMVDTNEQALLEALYTIGPVVVAINADGQAFQNYHSGVYSGNNGYCSENTNHAVTAVGFTPEAILIQNSWGTNWGSGGFIQIKRGYCGIYKQMAGVTLK